MAKTLTLTHDDDAFFLEGIEALAADADLPNDATAEEKLEAAKTGLRTFLREAVKNHKIQQLRMTQHEEAKSFAVSLDAVLDAQSDKLQITVE